MDNKVISKKTKITAIIKKFKEILELQSDRAAERHLMYSKNALKGMKTQSMAKMKLILIIHF